MRGAIKIVVVLLLVLLAGGLVLSFIGKARNTAQLLMCQNNLRSLGLALETYHDCQEHFPTGTVPNPALPPDRRLSWVTEVWPTFMEGGIANRLDKAKAWDASPSQQEVNAIRKRATRSRQFFADGFAN